MSSSEYIANALRAESKEYSFEGVAGLTPRIEHSIIGIASEAGELMDVVKKCKIYGKDLDRVNLIEEMGDIMWYLALASDELGISFEEIWEKNIAKLKTRYPEKYSLDNAMNRNLDEERESLS
jgi:NTP pyrophosphatase (non-canonical NTP hydrolase)